MAALYVRKRPSEESRWGVELTAQAGKDDEFFGFSATAPNIAGFKFLRHLGPTNVSYLAPTGKGLTLQADIFNSLIGYDSLYAKDNFNYTRPCGADFDKPSKPSLPRSNTAFHTNRPTQSFASSIASMTRGDLREVSSEARNRLLVWD
jgi:hypothetical protein